MTLLCPNPPTMNVRRDQKWQVYKFSDQHWDAVAPLSHHTNGACCDTFQEALAHALKGE